MQAALGQGAYMGKIVIEVEIVTNGFQRARRLQKGKGRKQLTTDARTLDVDLASRFEHALDFGQRLHGVNEVFKYMTEKNGVEEFISKRQLLVVEIDLLEGDRVGALRGYIFNVNAEESYVGPMCS